VVAAVWQAARDSEQRLKDRVSLQARELTQMEFDLRIRSLESGTCEQREFLAAAKAYRILYKALLLLHEKGEWPKEVEDAGLLEVYKLRRSGK
jgi:hypothetical protein